MTENSKIEWTDHTFNPWIGCTKVSPGCDHCYAEGVAERFKMAEWGAGKPRKKTSVANWNQPRAWNEKARAAGAPARVFCASLADVFDNEVDPDWRLELWQLIRETPWLSWQLLTKRIGNAAKMLPPDWPFKNAGLMISVVNQEEADRDIPKLLALPATWRGLSMEPLLQRVDLLLRSGASGGGYIPTHTPVDWVIVGGESGTGARPLHPDWVSNLREQCAFADIPFFFKQWGEWFNHQGGHRNQKLERMFLQGETHKAWMVRVGKKAAGRLLDGKEYSARARNALA